MEKNTSRKLTLELVQQMRKDYGDGATQGALARYYGVSVVQVGRIVRGECWMEGAGVRMPTQAEMDATLARLLAIQEDVKKYGPTPAPWERKAARPELEISPEVQERARSFGARIPPAPEYELPVREEGKEG